MDLHHKTIGNGPPVLIIHGLFGSGKNWRRTARSMQTEYTSILVDLRNHGSSAHHDKMGYLDMARDIADFIAANELAPVTILGHSMGGKVAMTLAIHYPRCVQKLIIVDIAPIRYKDNLATTITAMKNLDMDVVDSRTKAEMLLSRGVPDRAMRLFLLQNLLLTSGKASWSCNVSAIGDAVPEIIGPVPTSRLGKYLGLSIFIRGEHSDYIGTKGIAEINQLFPKNRIRTAKGTAHWPHTENPKEFMKILYESLKM